MNAIPSTTKSLARVARVIKLMLKMNGIVETLTSAWKVMEGEERRDETEQNNDRTCRSASIFHLN